MGEADALDRFVLTWEPAGLEAEKDFRNMLADVLAEVAPTRDS